MKIRIFSDVHLEFGGFQPPAASADVVVLAGDIGLGRQGLDWARRHFPSTPVVYVLGNHEYYDQSWKNRAGELQRLASGTNVHVLENQAVMLGGVCFLGCSLWADFDLFGNAAFSRALAGAYMTDYWRIKPGRAKGALTPAETEARHQWSRNWLAAAGAACEPGRRTVVVTHHAPSLQSVPEPWWSEPLMAAYASRLDQMVEKTGPAVWVHGHVHTANDYWISNTRVVSNPRGYPGEQVEGFAPDRVVEVQGAMQDSTKYDTT